MNKEVLLQIHPPTLVKFDDWVLVPGFFKVPKDEDPFQYFEIHYEEYWKIHKKKYSYAKYWDVLSSDGITKYKVVYRNGDYTCNCAGFGFRRHCRHVIEISENFKER